MSHTHSALLERLAERGVLIHAPHSVVLEDLDPERFEPGAQIYPGSVVRGRRTYLASGATIGRGGGGSFENVVVGPHAELYSGVFEDCVVLDHVIVRGHAELRGGTLLEERCEAAHHAGYKMTIMLPCVVAGSLVNFCDALVAGGTSRADHSEIGSTLALYNFTPWGDKFASLFGDVPRGVFMRSPRIFIGGQTQIVSPVRVGFGALIPAGCAVRRDVPAGRLYGEPARAFDAEFDARLYGALGHKLDATAEFIGNLHALLVWYRHVRLPFAQRRNDATHVALYEAATRQIQAGLAERIKRLAKMVARLPASLALHEAAAAAANGGDARTLRRIDEHRRVIEGWPALSSHLETPPTLDDTQRHALDAVATALAATPPTMDYLSALATALDAPLVAGGTLALERIVAATLDHDLLHHCRSTA